jgi:MFS family permease
VGAFPPADGVTLGSARSTWILCPAILLGVPETVGEVPETDQRQRWLSRGVGGIGTASFFADVGHEVPTALLPSLVTSTLGGSAAALGVIEGVSDGLAGAARLAGGALADDPTRRRAVAVGGYTSTAVLASLTGGATAVWQVAILRAGAWTARGLRVPARNALLADVVPTSAYGRAYGFERAMDNLGAIFGPLLAIGLVAVVGVRWAIGLSVIPGVLAAVAIVYAIRHTRKAESRERSPIRLRLRPVLRGELGRLMFAVAAFEVGNVAATLLILRATELLTPDHGLETATRWALWLYVAYNVAATVASIPAGRIADHLGSRGPVLVLAGGVAMFGLAYTGFGLTGASVAVLALPFVAAGIGIGAVETAEHAAVAALAPEDTRGSAFGLLAAIQALGNVAASAVAGVLWTAVSPRAAFIYLAAWMALALVGLVTTRTRRSNTHTPAIP